MYLAGERLRMVPEVAEPARDVALRELDHVYSFIYSRVGNRADAVHDEGRGDALTAPMHAQAWVERVLSALPGNYRQVLELRFLRGYSLRETAEATGNTVGAIKVMQLRALRAAARLGSP